MLPLAYTPFLDPINFFHSHWLWLMPPLVLAVCLVYKTLKLPTLDNLIPQTLRMSFYLVLFMVAVAAALWLIVAYV
jgi:hypothetical protein